MKKLVFLLGSPLSGKSVTTMPLRNKGIAVVGMGSILREKAKEDKMIADTIDRGEFLSEGYISKLAIDAVHQALLTSDNVVIEGFPRKYAQLDYITDIISPFCRVGIIYLNAKFTQLSERINRRVVCEQCGNTVDFSQRKCECGGNTKKRNDDNESVFLKRYNDFIHNIDTILYYLNVRYPIYAVLFETSVEEKVLHIKNFIEVL